MSQTYAGDSDAPSATEHTPKVGWVSVLQAFDDACVRDPWRLAGLRIMRVGVVLMLLASCVSVSGVLIFYGVALGGAVLARFPMHRMPGFWWAVAFSAWLILCVAMSPYATGISIPGMVYGWPMVYLVVGALAGSISLHRVGLAALLVSAMITGSVAVVQLTMLLVGSPLKPDQPWYGAHGMSGHHLMLGFMMAAILTLMGTSHRAMGLHAAPAWVTRVVATLALLASGARGAMLALIFAMAARLGARGLRHALLGLAIGIIIAAAGVAVLRYAHPPRAKALASGEDVRWELWSVTLHIIQRHPILGTGSSKGYVRAKEAAFEQGVGYDHPFVAKANHPHNIFLSLQVSYGLPGLILVGGWFAVVLLAVWRHRSHPTQHEAWSFMLALLVLVVMAGMTEDVLGRANTRGLIFLLMGFTLAWYALPQHTTTANVDD